MQIVDSVFVSLSEYTLSFTHREMILHILERKILEICTTVVEKLFKSLLVR